MNNNFDLKKYLIENKMTRNSRLLNENETNSPKYKIGDYINFEDDFELEDGNYEVIDLSVQDGDSIYILKDDQGNTHSVTQKYVDDYANNNLDEEQELSIEDELMAQLDEKVGPWSLKKGDQHPENFEPSYDDEDYEEYKGHKESETPEEEYEEHQPGGEEELDEEINDILEMDKQELSEEDDLYTMDEFDENLN